ncbi:ShlB/FhaC/HecB family hemolysin secretion/activation protein [Candidatus Venteria ishoeyi]|nr:ShlB/FhaC/HecB family hemolysin secretion/activation protein [Candidatus Venteria ishoeyi]
MLAGFLLYSAAWVSAAPPQTPLPLPPISLPENQLSAMAEIYVKHFELSGNKTVKTETLLDLIKTFSNRKISAEELQEVRNILTHYYVDNGYINSGVVIPDQEINETEKIIRLNIIEGRLVKINLQKAEAAKLQPDYIKQRLSYGENEILNVNTLQERLQILQQNPLISRFNAELGPGIYPGEAILNLEIKEARAWNLGFSANNHRSPSIGGFRGELFGHHRNLLGFGDHLSGRVGLTKGLNDYAIDYNIPLNRYDTQLELHAERSDSKIVSEPFSQLDITSDAEVYKVGLRHPFYRTYSKDFHYRVFDMGLALNVSRSETRLLDELFGFPPVIDGINKITALHFSQNWLDRSRNRVIAFSSNFRFGLSALNSTVHEGIDPGTGQEFNAPDSKFALWLGQFRWIERLPLPWDKKRNSQLLLRADLQYSDDDLLPLEKFAMGGANTVRGYRENLLTRDKGIVLSLEWQIPVYTWTVPMLGAKANEGDIFITPFIDYGWVKNNFFEIPGKNSLSSIGLGVLWKTSAYMDAAVYWGHALQDMPAPEDKDIQDDGIHFALNLYY